MEFRMLGPVELWSDGENHALGSRKERHVLAVLLWEHGRQISTRALLRIVWEDDPSDKSLNSLYSTVSRLRANLHEITGKDRDWLRQHAGSYALPISSESVDFLRFRDLRDKAKVAAARGDHEVAIALLREADRLWHGIPLAGLHGRWADGVRVQLNEERFAATVMRVQAELTLGRHADLIAELFEFAAKYPLVEPPTKNLMIALHRSGRRADAVHAYLRFRRHHRDEFGSEPSPELRALHQQIITGDLEITISAPVRPASPDASPRTPSPGTPSSTMPRSNPDFTGRAAELETLTSWLDSASAQSSAAVVVISGMPGVGKTGLALHVAHLLRERYPDQKYLSLCAHDPDGESLEPTRALGTLLRRLGVPDGVLPAGTEDRAALWRSMLTGRRALILLDDALDVGQVLPLLPGDPGCLVIVTTRRRTLSLPGMLFLPLDPLRHADAAALLTRAAGAGKADDPAAVASVVRLCGYVPLKIQLAGRKLRGHPAWGVADLASRLSDMRSDDHDMTTAFALSYRYLTPGEQQLFRGLAQHPGESFSTHAAAAVAGDVSPATTERTLEMLLDSHLIEEPVTGRYTFHNLIREYAADLSKTIDTGEDRRRAMGRLLDYYLGLADRADRIVHPFRRRFPMPDTFAPPDLPPLSTRRECADRLEAEKTSLLGVARYAAAEGWPEHAALLAHLLGGFLDTWGDWTDAIDLHRRAIEAWQATGNAAGKATSLVELGFILWRTGHHTEATGCVRDALTIARDAQDKRATAVALDTMGVILSRSAGYREALACHDQALAIWRELGDRHGEADALSRSVMAAAHLGKHPDALRRAELAIAAYREQGDLQGEANALNNLGGLQQDARCYDEALSSYEQAMVRFLEIGDRQGEAIALSNIGGILRLSRRHAEALGNYRAALDILRFIGDRRSEAETLNGMAETFADADNYQAALDQYEMALALASELAERSLLAASMLGLGSVRLRLDRHAMAADDYRAAAELSRQIGDPQQEADALYGLGCALLPIGGEAAARKPWRRALALLQELGSPQADKVRARLQAPHESAV